MSGDDRTLSRRLLDDLADGRVNPFLLGELVARLAPDLDASEDQGDDADSGDGAPDGTAKTAARTRKDGKA